MALIRRFRTTILLFIMYMSIPVFLMSTNPQDLPLVLLVIPFLLLFAALFATVYLFLRRHFSNLGHRARRGLALVLASLPVLLLILKSINQLSIRDVLITVGLFVMLAFYFKKTDFLK